MAQWTGRPDQLQPTHKSRIPVRKNNLDTEPGEGSPVPSSREGLTYAQGPHAKCEKKFLVFSKIYSKYKINKHVESLPKVDKSITF